MKNYQLLIAAIASALLVACGSGGNNAATHSDSASAVTRNASDEEAGHMLTSSINLGVVLRPLGVAPLDYSFGDVVQGTKFLGKGFTVNNGGALNLRLESVTGIGGASFFSQGSTTSRICSANMKLYSGGNPNCQIRVRLNTTGALGPFSGRIIVKVVLAGDARKFQEVAIDLSGQIVAQSAVSAGLHNTCYLNQNKVSCAGYEGYGVNKVPPLSNPKMVSVGAFHACAIDDSGVKCWGVNLDGQIRVPALSNPKMVSAGHNQTCAIDDSGVTCWGNNRHLGEGRVRRLISPKMVSVGSYFSCGIDDSGVKCWGPEDYAQTAVLGLSNPKMVSVGTAHICAVDDSGVKCWGDNRYGQASVPPLSHPKMVSAGYYHNCALDDSGVKCWGNNSEGQTNVPALSNPKVVSASWYHTCAIHDFGVKCWGSNKNGQTNFPTTEKTTSAASMRGLLVLAPDLRDGRTVWEFTIKQGTGSNSWNSIATTLELKVGEVLRIRNADDSKSHGLHTNMTPCRHGGTRQYDAHGNRLTFDPNKIEFGGFIECDIDSAIDASTADSTIRIYDQQSGTSARLYLISRGADPVIYPTGTPASTPTSSPALDCGLTGKLPTGFTYTFDIERGALVLSGTSGADFLEISGRDIAGEILLKGGAEEFGFSFKCVKSLIYNADAGSDTINLEGIVRGIDSSHCEWRSRK